MGARTFAMSIGIIYLILGVLGFIPAMRVPPAIDSPSLVIGAGYGYLFGLFAVNVLHNLVHLVVGAMGIYAYNSYASSRKFAQSLAIFFGIITVMGLIPLLRTTFGLMPLFGHDIWLHGISAVVAGYFGWREEGTVSTHHVRETDRAA